jgi:hypothetical protein
VPGLRLLPGSTRAPTRPGPGSPAGTSSAWPSQAASPTRTLAGTTAELRWAMAHDVVPACGRRRSGPSSPRGGRDLGGLGFRRFGAGLVSSTFSPAVDHLPQRCRFRLVDWGYEPSNRLPQIDRSMAAAPT